MQPGPARLELVSVWPMDSDVCVMSDIRAPDVVTVSREIVRLIFQLQLRPWFFYSVFIETFTRLF